MPKHKREIEEHLCWKERHLFNLEEKIILYDLTNTFFEGSGKYNSKSRFEKVIHIRKSGIDVHPPLGYTSSKIGGMTDMSNVKTAISIQEALFKEVDAMARQMGVPRSQLFVMAVEEFIRQYSNQQLLEQIDQAYGDEPHSADRDHPAKMKPRHRQLVEGQW